MATRSAPPICDSAAAATESFNAHDLDALADVLADDVVCRVPCGEERGRAVCVDYVRVARIRRGKQVSVSLVFDRLLMLEQLGLA